MIIGSTYNLNNTVHNNPVILNNKPLSRTGTFECVGVLLEEKLKWDKHIDKILKKVWYRNVAKSQEIYSDKLTPNDL